MINANLLTPGQLFVHPGYDPKYGEGIEAHTVRAVRIEEDVVWYDELSHTDGVGRWGLMLDPGDMLQVQLP